MKVIVVIDHGCLVAAYSDCETVDVELLDYDNMRMSCGEEFDGYKALEEEIESDTFHCVY